MSVTPVKAEPLRLLEALAEAERRYRQVHHRYGGDSMAAAQARDRLRSVGHHARQYLRECHTTQQGA